MLRSLIMLILVAMPVIASAGVRATFAVRMSPPITMTTADNGDMSIELMPGRRLLVKGNEAFIVEERLTGPIVTRLDDLEALVRERATEATPAAPGGFILEQRGVMEIAGRAGRAYFLPAPQDNFRDEEPVEEKPVLVISDDPLLAGLSPMVRAAYRAQRVGAILESGFPVFAEIERAMLRPLEDGAPLQFGEWSLRRFERAAIDPESITLPAEPETAAALRARLVAEASENGRGPNPDHMIQRAIFSMGRLFLLADNGSLTSLAEGERMRARHDLDGPIRDICRHDGTVLALTGGSDEDALWRLHRWDGSRWHREQTIERAGDTATALACAPGSLLLLTNQRLLDLSSDAPPLPLSWPEEGRFLTTAVHPTPDAVFVGLNSGEWGGGMRRIDRRTGRIDVIARNTTGDLCDGPLNTNCDPVHGIANLPWRPECIAAAIGLIHFAPHGRIAAICPDGIEQLHAALDAVDEADPDSIASAAAGRYGSVAFFGLAAIDGALVAAGHNGLHRLDADGRTEHRSWPRFIEIDGALVSFALDDVVLVLTSINRRASISGAVPILVPR